MTGELEAIVRKVFDAVDRKDIDALHQVSDDDIQGVDEVSRKWLRGRDAADRHWRQGLMAVDGIRTELGDFSEATFGEIGVVTYWMEQDYTLEGTLSTFQGLQPPSFVVGATNGRRCCSSTPCCRRRRALSRRECGRSSGVHQRPVLDCWCCGHLAGRGALAHRLEAEPSGA